jgi:hypothetical protein
MTTQNSPPNGIDISRPNVARIYDYLLGGKDNFAVDREAAKQLLTVTPDMAGVVRDNRSFIGRVVRHLATEGGIRQFIDLGGGLPTQTNVHEMAQQVEADARVVYSVLHFVADEDDPYRIVAEYRDHMAPGSYLAISHGTTGTAEEDPNDVVGGVTSVYRQASAQLHVRSLAGIRRFFDGFDLIEPGVVWINEWRPDPGIPPAGQPRSLRGGVGRKS